MTEALERIAADSCGRLEEDITTYDTIDIYADGTVALYTPPPKPFAPAIKPIGGIGSPYGVLDNPDYLGKGSERFRKPEWDPVHGNHMNYEITAPGIKKPLTNIHIPMDKNNY